MSEIIFGTPEHVAGLSRKALEEDFQWVNDRRMELEGECERLDAENARLQSQADEWRRVAQSKQDVIDHMRDARDENAKLRELVSDVFDEAGWRCGECWADGHGMDFKSCEASDCSLRAAYVRACGLGVEVDG